MDSQIKPEFSIILPCYNAAKTIECTLKLLQQQTFSDYEIIVINDGSLDETATIVQRIAKNDYRVKLYNQKNSGAAVARNYGLEHAIGKWILFCDSDDKMTSLWIQSYADCLEKDVDLISQGYQTDNGKQVQIKEQLYANHDINEWIKKAQNSFLWGFLWCKAFKADIIRKNLIHFKEGLAFQEDLEFVLHYLTYCSSIYQTDKLEYLYTSDGNENKYKYHRRMESSKSCIYYLRTLQKCEISVQILYFQRMMIEDIYIGYIQNDTYKKKQNNINTLYHTFPYGLNWNNCIGVKRKIFYIFYTYLPFSTLDLIMKFIAKRQDKNE